MSASSAHIYLARLGKIFGPYSEREIFDLQGSGKIYQYTWIWDELKKLWKPIDPAPHAPGTETRPEQHLERAELELRSVICHNFRALMKGELSQLTETGCLFRVQEASLSPKMNVEGRVLLNIMVEGEGSKTINVPAQVAGVSRNPEGWTYRLRWDHLPSVAA